MPLPEPFPRPTIHDHLREFRRLIPTLGAFALAYALIIAVAIGLSGCAILGPVTTDLNNVAGWNMLKKDAFSTGQGP